MSDTNHTRRGFIAGGAAAVAALGASSIARAGSSSKSKGKSGTGAAKYAITTLHLKFNADAEFNTVLSAVVPLLLQRGVRLARAWTPIIGQYRKMVGIWEAASYDDFIDAFADPALAAYRERLEALGSATIEFASVLVPGPGTLTPEARRGGVIPTGTITILPGKAEQFRRIVEDSGRIMGKHGVVLDASYATQIGNRTRVLDVWWAPDANSAYAAVMDPAWNEQLVDLDWTGTLAGEGAELAEVCTELSFG